MRFLFHHLSSYNCFVAVGIGSDCFELVCDDVWPYGWLLSWSMVGRKLVTIIGLFICSRSQFVNHSSIRIRLIHGCVVILAQGSFGQPSCGEALLRGGIAIR